MPADSGVGDTVPNPPVLPRIPGFPEDLLGNPRWNRIPEPAWAEPDSPEPEEPHNPPVTP